MATVRTIGGGPGDAGAMSLSRLLWIDMDATHARAAAGALAAAQPAWEVIVVHSEASALQAASDPSWAGIVLVLPGAAPDLPELLARLCAHHPVLLCVDASQEALAARAFRQGIHDYVLRAPGWRHFPEVAQRLEAMLAQPTPHGAHSPEAGLWQQAVAALRQERSDLQVALACMSQGICTTDATGRVIVYNPRALDLLDMPESLFATRPTLAELTRIQAARGDFGPNYQDVDPRGRNYVAQGLKLPAPEVYWRTARDGRTLEIRTRYLEGGGMVRTYADVSEYVRVQNSLRESEARFRSLSDLSSDWYWEQDESYRFVQLAGDWSINGVSSDEVLGRTRWDLGALNMSEDDWQAHRQVLDAREPFRELELHRRRHDGTLHWIAVSGVPVFDAQNVFRGYRGVGRDISERKQAEGQIERLAFFDVLTGLPNRRLLTDRLERSMLAAGRNGLHGALLFIDLDNFKDLNDTLGHDTGDRLLVQVARRLQGCVREADTVARFGGDEFVVLLENLHQDLEQASAEAARIARHVADTLALPYTMGDAGHHSTPSIGIALFGQEAPSVEELLKRADLAMYQAKAAGRNTQRFFDPEMQATVSSRAALEAELRRGLQQHELVLHCQPAVNARGRLLGAEALVRWNHPARGLVSPAEFIPLAEQTGLILPLGLWVLRAACEQLVAWSRSPVTRALYLSVNVSVRQFRQADFVEQVLGALHASGANPERLKLELTESLLMTDVEDVIARMEVLRSHGVGFSLDDFGTGYSSLSYLKRLPLEQIKIDQGFVRDLEHNAGDAAIVRTILALAQSLDLQVVAEGVETQGQLEFLKHHGCEAFQGYLFGRPMPVEVLERALLIPVP